ncbi:MAG: hypothetical protein KatS3mg111_0897 [Pirellulaceae bacterium]|nr:MAG: hypothetical protein KatS3mg111_0897 [Pirellulaceae bacterium]
MDRSRRIEQLTDTIRRMLHGDGVDRALLARQFPECAADLESYIETIQALESLPVVPPRPHVRPGLFGRTHTLGGFTLIRELGRGGMGVVYEAHQPQLSRRVAMKVLPPHPEPTPENVRRFRREATAAARLHHSNIVPIFGAGEDDGIHYCVMQLIDGHSLDRLLPLVRERIELELPQCVSPTEGSGGVTDHFPLAAAAEILVSGSVRAEWGLERDPTDRPLVGRQPMGLGAGMSPQDWSDTSRGWRRMDTNSLRRNYIQNIARIGVCVADALQHAHRHRVLHRDIKPGNIILDREGRPWVADFGLAKLESQDDLTASGCPIGTLRFTAPEQLSGHCDVRSDVYSLGVTLCELLTLQPSFEASNRGEMVKRILDGVATPYVDSDPAIPTDLKAIVRKAMAVEPSMRYQTAGHLADDLRRYLQGYSVHARAAGWFTRSLRWCRRHRRQSTMAGVALGSLLAVAITSFLAFQRESQLRHRSEATTTVALAALDRVFDSYLPDWSDTFSATLHGAVGVSQRDAELLEGLLTFYGELAEENDYESGREPALRRVAACRKVGMISYRLGDTDKAKLYLGKALAELQRLHGPFGASPQLRFQTALVYNELGEIYWSARQIEEAHQFHESALAELNRLGVTFGSVSAAAAEQQFEFCRTLYFLARRGRGRLGGAPLRPVIAREQERYDLAVRSPMRSTMTRRAIEMTEKLVAHYPHDDNAKLLLALCYRATSDGSLDDTGQAVHPQLETALDILRDLYHRDPDNGAVAFALCRTLQWINLWGPISQERRARIEQQLLESAAIAQRLRRDRPNEWMYSAAEAEAYLYLARCVHKCHLPHDALHYTEQAIQLTRELTERYPNCDAFAYWLGVEQSQRGRLLCGMDREAEACAAFDEAIRWLQRCAERSPHWQHIVLADISEAAEHWAQALTVLGNHEEAHQRWQMALAVSLRPTDVGVDHLAVEELGE